MKILFYIQKFHGIPVVMLKREKMHAKISAALRRSRAVGLIGPRQCGKTTIARTFVNVDSLNYFDLEDPTSLARLNDPK